jgi:cytochrome b pre-mRNA-processing protein 3
MILRAFRRTPQARVQAATIDGLYGAIVAQARSPAFYTHYGVPDTVEGRFELLVLHLVLLLRHLGGTDGPAADQDRHGRAAGQSLFDRFCRDLDHNLREMGVGDLAVPKRMRRFAEAFYGRQAAYLAALAGADAHALENALARNIFAETTTDQRAARLARYTRAAAGKLDTEEEGALAAGAATFPRPEAFLDE